MSSAHHAHPAAGRLSKPGPIMEIPPSAEAAAVQCHAAATARLAEALENLAPLIIPLGLLANALLPIVDAAVAELAAEAKQRAELDAGK